MNRVFKFAFSHLNGIKVFALVGRSGTGKSHHSKLLAQKYHIDLIIDDGLLIRGDKILAASVYYTPTTRALTGKYGSRHRAAFGISEISDAVTIVVSEETGRISLTYKGRMESTTYDSFLSDFTSLMEDTEA